MSHNPMYDLEQFDVTETTPPPALVTAPVPQRAVDGIWCKRFYAHPVCGTAWHDYGWHNDDHRDPCPGCAQLLKPGSMVHASQFDDGANATIQCPPGGAPARDPCPLIEADADDDDDADDDEDNDDDDDEEVVCANDEDMFCPSCGHSDDLSVELTMWANLTDDGLDTSYSEHNWSRSSDCTCRNCGWCGTAGQAEDADGRP